MRAGTDFNYDLIRAVVKAGLSSVRRQLLHRRVGRALEQFDPDEVAALAYHFDAGGEGEKALRYHGLAAQRAEALFAWREAEGHQGRMLELLNRLDPDRSEPARLAQRGQVLAARAHLRFLQGRLAERDADMAALTALAKASGDEGLRLQALVHRTRYLNLGGQYEEAIATAEEGLSVRLNDTSARSHLLVESASPTTSWASHRRGLPSWSPLWQWPEKRPALRCGDLSPITWATCTFTWGSTPGRLPTSRKRMPATRRWVITTGWPGPSWTLAFCT
jgi:hypothetical protein